MLERVGLRVTDAVEIPESELIWRFSRSSGPGGQGVNTTGSRVQLSVDVAAVLPEPLAGRALRRLPGRLVDGVLTVVASEHRSQLRNRDAARERLAALLAAAIAPDPPARRPTRPSRGAREQRLRTKRRRAETKRLRGPVDDG